MRDTGNARASKLCEVLSKAREVLIVSHYHPDPDALASAAALGQLLTEAIGLTPILTSSGEIGRAENRALVRLLELELVPLDDVMTIPGAAIVLVDTQPGRANNPLPDDLMPAAVVDHHPDWGETSRVPFVDLRPDYGATATIVTQYFQELELFLEPPLAAALFYGISSETQRLAREASAADIVAAQFLFPYVDKRLLGSVQTPALPEAHFVMMAEAVRNTLIWDDVALTFIDQLPYSDAAGEISDLMIRLESVAWAACIGRRHDDLIVSARTNETGTEAGQLLASIFPAGSAGGHSMTAGGKIPLSGADWIPTARECVARLLEQLGRTGKLVKALAPDPSTTVTLISGELPRAIEPLPPSDD